MIATLFRCLKTHVWHVQSSAWIQKSDYPNKREAKLILKNIIFIERQQCPLIARELSQHILYTMYTQHINIILKWNKIGNIRVGDIWACIGMTCTFKRYRVKRKVPKSTFLECVMTTYKTTTTKIWAEKNITRQ